jgi:hypothetical protein
VGNALNPAASEVERINVTSVEQDIPRLHSSFRTSRRVVQDGLTIFDDNFVPCLRPTNQFRRIWYFRLVLYLRSRRFIGARQKDTYSVNEFSPVVIVDNNGVGLWYLKESSTH